MPPKIPRTLLGGAYEDANKATQPAEPEWLYSLYPSMRPKPAEDFSGLSPEDRALYSLYPTMRPKAPPANDTARFQPAFAPAAAAPLIVGSGIIAAPYAVDAAKKTWDALSKKTPETPPSTLIIPDAPENNAPTPERFPPAPPLPEQPPSHPPRQPEKPLPPSTRPEVKKDDSILADPIDEQANQGTIFEISKLPKPIPITPGQPLPEKIEQGLRVIKNPEQANYVKGLISSGYQVSGIGKDGCNIDIKGDYDTIKAHFDDMEKHFGGRIVDGWMGRKPQQPGETGKEVVRLDIGGEQTMKVNARRMSSSTEGPTLEIVFNNGDEKQYTVKIRTD